jgi:hypothetical protein
MNNYVVRIKATVTKDIDIKAANEKEAVEVAQAVFTVAPEDSIDEDYDEEIVFVKKV